MLKEQNILTRTGRNNWDHSVICCLLKNPAYIGKAAFGKAYIGKMQPRLRPYHGCSEQPKKAYSTFQNPKEKWINIPAPAIVEKKLFDAAKEKVKKLGLKNTSELFCFAAINKETIKMSKS